MLSNVIKIGTKNPSHMLTKCSRFTLLQIYHDSNYLVISGVINFYNIETEIKNALS